MRTSKMNAYHACILRSLRTAERDTEWNGLARLVKYVGSRSPVDTLPLFSFLGVSFRFTSLPIGRGPVDFDISLIHKAES